MNKEGVSFESVKNDLIQDEKFKEEYEKLQPSYEMISQIIKERKEQE